MPLHLTWMDERMGEDEIEEILLALRHEQVAVREEAVQRIRDYSNSAGSEEETEGLTEAEELELWDKARTLRLNEKPIAEALIMAMEDSSPQVRSAAALLLGNVTTPEAQDALIRHLLYDPIKHVRIVCVAALFWTPDTPQKMEGCIAALKDPHYQVVCFSCISLGKMGDSRAVEPLRSVLTHPAWTVRFDACEALVRLQAVDPSLVSVLEELNQQPEAREHDEMMLSMSDFEVEFGMGGVRPLTTQEVLEQARRALQ